MINDRFRIYFGGFWANVDSEITINGQNQSPPPISPENVLGIEDSKGVLFGGARWRISRCIGRFVDVVITEALPNSLRGRLVASVAA